MISPEITEFDQKVECAKEDVKEILTRAKKPCICFSGGKKSLVLLHLIKTVTKKESVPVIFVDTTAHIDNTRHYVEKMRKLWGFHLINIYPLEPIKNIARERDICCKSLIITPLCECIQKNGFDYIFIGSIPTEDRIKRLFDAHAGKKNCTSVSPAEKFQTADIWRYIDNHNLPYCSLYKTGYARVDCGPCSQINDSPQKNNLISNDEDLIKAQLKKLGYL